MSVVELVAPRTLIDRWSRHDVHVLVDAPRIWLRADDVEAVTGIPPWGRGEQLLLDDGTLERILGADYYVWDAVIDRARAEDTAVCRDFMRWLRGKRPLWLDPGVLEHAHQPVPFVEAYTVSQAAQLLGTGRQALFEDLHEAGWITRDPWTGDWAPTPPAYARDWLTLREMRVGAPVKGGRRSYRQIHVTPAGVDELRQLLTVPDAPDPPALTPTLFD